MDHWLQARAHLWGGDELMQQMGGGAFGGRRKIAVSGKRI
jgi:hypothetical protein